MRKLTLAALLAAAALWGTASAATATTIQVANLVNGLPNIEMTGRVTFTAFETRVTCNKTMRGVLERTTTGTLRLGENRAGIINEVRFGECTGGTVTAALVRLGAEARLSWVRVGLREFTLAASDLRVLVEAGLGFVKCLYQADLQLTGTAAAGGLFTRTTLQLLTRSLRLIERLRGAVLCPTEATIEGTLTFTRPSAGVEVRADTAPAAEAWIVSVGDSYASGEGGRWAGNTAKVNEEPIMDRFGEFAYFDAPGWASERTPGCHRSFSAEIHILTVNSVNIACSGAKVASYRELFGSVKPGLDEVEVGGVPGQATQLKTFAEAHRREIKMVVISIGGNDFGFGEIVLRCVTRYIIEEEPCNSDPAIARFFERGAIGTVKANVQRGIENIRNAMRRAGYADAAYTIMIQNYMSPIPAAREGIRYPERSGRGEEGEAGEVEEEPIPGKRRQWKGGCGFYDTDARWANETALPEINRVVEEAAVATGFTNIKRLDLASAFNGRRLCETGVGLLEEQRLAGWWFESAMDRTEWISSFRTEPAYPNLSPFEYVHPNFWGQMALRNCVRRAYNEGAPRSGRCTIERAGETGTGEPLMALM